MAETQRKSGVRSTLTPVERAWLTEAITISKAQVAVCEGALAHGGEQLEEAIEHLAEAEFQIVVALREMRKRA